MCLLDDINLLQWPKIAFKSLKNKNEENWFQNHGQDSSNEPLILYFPGEIKTLYFPYSQKAPMNRYFGQSSRDLLYSIGGKGETELK